MNRTSANLLIDISAAASVVGMIATGYILYFALPPGSNKSLLLWGLTRHQWGAIHFWLSVGLLAVLVVHLFVHWQWVVATVMQRLGLSRNPQSRHIRSGVITLLTMIAAVTIFAWIAQISIREQSAPLCPPNLPAERGDAERGDTASNGAAAVDDARSQIEFWRDVNPIFQASCLRCHGPSRAQAHFRVDRRDDFFGTAGMAAFVVPGNSAESSLIAIVRGQRPDMAMAAAHRLPDRQVDILRAWIDSGAPWPEKSDTR